MASPRKKRERGIAFALLNLAGLVIIGALGFMIVSGGQRSLFEALWMTVQILTTVGDSGIQRSGAEQLWSIVLMLVGVTAVYYLGITVVRFVLDGELRDFLGRRQLETRIKGMNLMVVAVVHQDGQRSFNPSPDTPLNAGDELIVIGGEGGVGKMLELFGMSV